MARNLPQLLVVDDNPTNRLLINGILKKLPITILSAATGQEAIDLAANNSPFLILMDVDMPGMNGFEAAAVIARDNDSPSRAKMISWFEDDFTHERVALPQEALAQRYYLFQTNKPL